MLQEGHPVAVKEAQNNINWLESLTRGIAGDGARGKSFVTVVKWGSALFRGRQSARSLEKVRLMLDQGYGPLLREYVYFLLAKLAFHKQHPEFNGIFLPRGRSDIEADVESRSFRI